MVEIIFLRHGRSRADDEGRFEGRYDSPLTDQGRDQASRRAEEWVSRGERFDEIISSPLVRALETAKIIGEQLGCRVTEDPQWLEMDSGNLAGLSYEEGRTRFPVPAFVSPYDQIAGTGESGWELHARAAVAVESVVNRGDGRYLVVAHGGIINAALRTIIGTGPPVNFGGIKFHLGDLGYVTTKYLRRHHGWTIVELASGLE